MKTITLKGWNVEVKRTWIQSVPKDGEDAEALPGWTLEFHEKVPPTGNVIEFTFGEATKDYIVRELSGGIVLPPGSTSIENFRPEGDSK